MRGLHRLASDRSGSERVQGHPFREIGIIAVAATGVIRVAGKVIFKTAAPVAEGIRNGGSWFFSLVSRTKVWPPRPICGG